MASEGKGLERLEVGEAENEEHIVLEEGQELWISLPSNPSTGYGWEVIEGDNSVLEQIGEIDYHPPGSDREMPMGSRGVELLRFRAAIPGHTHLKLAYRRPWESGEPRESYSLEVRVGQEGSDTK